MPWLLALVQLVALTGAQPAETPPAETLPVTPQPAPPTVRPQPAPAPAHSPQPPPVAAQPQPPQPLPAPEPTLAHSLPPQQPPSQQPPPPFIPPPRDGPPDYEALDRYYGHAYPAPRGKGLRVAGGISLGTGAPLLFASLVCLVAGAGLDDSGESDDARILYSTAAGMGLWGLVSSGAGAAMLAVGSARRRRYHAWLLQQRAAPQWRPGAFVGPQRLGLAFTLQF